MKKTFEKFLDEAYQIYGPHPHGPSDAESIPLGRPYKNKNRAKTRADQLDQEIGGYRHKVIKVDEEFKDLTPEKEQRVKNRVGELARDIQVQGARYKELKNKPLSRLRPNIKKEQEEIAKSARKKGELVKNASDALIRTSTSRSANIQKRIENLKRLTNEAKEPKPVQASLNKMSAAYGGTHIRQPESIKEAKWENHLSPQEKESARNNRRFGRTRSPDSATGLRRTFNRGGRGIRNIPGDKQNYDLPITSRYSKPEEVQKRIQYLKNNQNGRQFLMQVKRELEAQKNQRKIAAVNAANKIVRRVKKK